MKQSVREFLLGDTIFWVCLVVVAVVVGLVSWLGHSRTSEILLLGAAVAALALLGSRSLLSGKVRLGSLVFSTWLVAFAALVLLDAPSNSRLSCSRSPCLF